MAGMSAQRLKRFISDYALNVLFYDQRDFLDSTI